MEDDGTPSNYLRGMTMGRSTTARKDKQTYSCYRLGGCEHLDLRRVADIRKNKSRYALWIDLEEKVFHERRKGSIGLFSKRIIGRLLCFMVMNAGKEYNFEELYESVWCLQGNNITEESVVKTNISRLRELIEPSLEWRYVMKTEPFLGVRGKYYFNPGSNYCMLRPDSLQLFNL